MRLDKLLSAENYGSRKAVRRLIQTKQVTVDGEIVLQDNLNVDPELQEIKVKNQVISGQGHAYYLLNKPQGVVSAVTDNQHQTVIECLSEQDRHPNLFPVGRLDRDTEGLVLLTDNGKLAYELLQPRKKTSKIYYALVNERVTDSDVKAFKEGIIFYGGIKCKPAKLEIISATENESEVRLTISEGKFHQVKKMFLAVGKKVVFLKRVSMGPLELDENLKVGEYRRLSEEEVVALKEYFR